MRGTLIVVGLFILALGMRGMKAAKMRKPGALLFLLASFFAGYFLTRHIWGGVLAAGSWFFLPWIELLTRIRCMRLPLSNRLRHRCLPDPSFFPNAPEAAQAMEEAGFEHVVDCGWEWAGMQQFFQLFWNPEERAVSSICLCEQCDVAFAFISVTSRDDMGNIWRTTNFPFAQMLRCPPEVRWNHVPCQRGCFHLIFKNHQEYLARMKVTPEQLRVPDPEELEDSLDTEMRRQVEYNVARGIVKLTDDGCFVYTTRGLFFLWGQFLKDMIRLC